MILFGSQTSGKTSPQSDIDLAVSANQPLAENKWDDLLMEIMKATKSNRIDLIDLKKQRGVLLNFQILTKGKCLFEKKQGLFREKQIESIWKYYDFKPVLNNQDRALDIQQKLLCQQR